ncbi:MAG: cation:proton antiporter [Alphaproteobacteria bacterium]|nr:cation:proton antiporter [Alphaproteobacteria bacterium]
MEYDLIKTIVACIVSAFVFGFIAKRFKLPTIFGYLLAGIAVGPYTPGMVADMHITQQLAEIGIILLMFGVGMHFSLKDLMAVRNIALPGALFQMVSATLIGALAMKLAGFPWSASIVYGFSLSVASTVVLLRALKQRKIDKTEVGKIAVGWLIVEDIVMVFAIVLLPALAEIINKPDVAEVAGNSDVLAILLSVAEVTLKISLFAALMILLGRRVLPWILVRVAKTKSRELATLGMLAIAMGFAYVAYSVFDSSFALGAFLAGLMINESEIGQKSADQTIPMRDVFAVLFFVSVGMLFDPAVLLEHPLLILMTLSVIIVGKSLAALFIMRLFKQDIYASWVIAISLAQIGEFSFVLAGMAVTLQFISSDLHSLILASALLSIAINHFLFKAMDKHFKPLPSDPESIARRHFV